MPIELKEWQKIHITSPKTLYIVMREIYMREDEVKRAQEHVWACSLRSDNKLLNVELVSLGSVDRVMLYPMQVFRFGLFKKASKMMLVHNHPPDLMIYSDEDLDMTDRLIQVGKIIDLPLVDHLIISEENFYSFESHGLIDKLQSSTKYQLTFMAAERLRNEGLKIGMEKGIQKGIKRGKREGKKEGRIEREREIARDLKKKGVPIDVIKSTTGLSEKEINKLK